MTRARPALFLLLFIASAGFHQPVEYDNTKSRWLLVGAVVDEGRLNIDSLHEYTVDKSLSNGQYYSIKAIGLPLIGAPFYWVAHKLIPSPFPSPNVFTEAKARYLVTLATVAIPFSLIGLVLLEVLLAMGVGECRAVWAVLAHGLGTIALINASIFSGHETSAAFIFFAFAILFLMQRKYFHRVPPGILGFVAGLFAGIGVLCDYTAAFIAVPMTYYAWAAKVPKATRAAFLAGAGVTAAILAAYNFACFGTVLTMSYAHHIVQATPGDLDHGVVGYVWPNPLSFLLMLFSPSRGLLFISPVLLLAIPGVRSLSRRNDFKLELRFIAAAALVTFFALSCYYGWHGGSEFGPRYLVPLLPFLMIPLAFQADGKPIFLVLFALSVFQVACAQLGCPHAAFEIKNPIIEFILPLMRLGVTSLNWIGRTALVGYEAGGLIQFGIVLILAVYALRSCPRDNNPRVTDQWNVVGALWSVCVVLALAFTRTPGANVVRFEQAKALHEAGFMLNSPALESESRRIIAGKTEQR